MSIRTFICGKTLIMMHRHEQSLEPLAYQVNAFCRALGISRTSFYELMKSGDLKTIVIAGRRLVPKTEVDRLIANATTAPTE
jgi:predicted DNA-binding transcriptional regulator AlpA